MLGVYDYAVKEYKDKKSGLCNWFLTPVITETCDTALNDVSYTEAITPEHVIRGLSKANSDPVPEGCTGGGTGMICQGWKGGTGSSSRLVGSDEPDETPSDDPQRLPNKVYTVAAHAQINYGTQRDLRIGGFPIGAKLLERGLTGFKPRVEDKPKETDKETAADASVSAKDSPDGSIIVILATDCPLTPSQLQRLAKRATVGLARTGGWGSNYSGDIFLAFSTGTKTARTFQQKYKAPAVSMKEQVDDQALNALFESAADATEEAIYNAMCMAETTEGPDGLVIEALPLDVVREIMGDWTG